jgi:hypothetical protein
LHNYEKMKKSIPITKPNNSFRATFKKSPSFVKLYDGKGKLLRHSRSSGKVFQFVGSLTNYTIESDAEIENITESKVDTAANFKAFYPFIELDSSKKRLFLGGMPFYETDNMATFLARMIKDEQELKGYFESYYQRRILSAKRRLLSSYNVIEMLIEGDETVKESLKQTALRFNKELERVKSAIQQAKDAEELLSIELRLPETLVHGGQS